MNPYRIALVCFVGTSLLGGAYMVGGLRAIMMIAFLIVFIGVFASVGVWLNVKADQWDKQETK